MNTNSIFLAWRPTDSSHGWAPVGQLSRGSDDIYNFFYTKGAARIEFNPLPGMQDLEKTYRSKELFPIFLIDC